MPGKKVDIIDVYKVVGIVMVGVMMALCRFHRVAGNWDPINIPKEMWAVIMNMITHTAMSITGVTVPSTPMSKHLKGGVVIGILGMMSASIALAIPVTEPWWGAVGTVSAILYGTQKDA